MRSGYRSGMRYGRRNSGASQVIVLGNLITDAQTPYSLGFEIPVITSLPYTATAELYYTPSGGSEQRAPDMIRLRSDLGSYWNRNEGFAGAIWDLQENTSYSLRIRVVNGTESAQATTVIATRQLASDTSAQAADTVLTQGTTQGQAQAALDAASNGNIIEFQGTHAYGGLIVPLGTDNLTIRGDYRDTAIVGDGASTWLETRANGTVIETLTIQGASPGTDYAIEVDGRQSTAGRASITGFTLRHCIINSRRGVKCQHGVNTEIYDVDIYDNDFNGYWSWSDIVSKKNGGTISDTWNDAAIQLTGQGHFVSQNTFSGYGDALKIQDDTAIFNTNILVQLNDVLWGGDDGLEFEDAYRNCVAYKNRLSNLSHGLSKQPVFTSGGPNYFVRNVIVNPYDNPQKLKYAGATWPPNGLAFVHNTFVRTNGESGSPTTTWYHPQTALDPANTQFLNNLWCNADPSAGRHIWMDVGTTLNEGVIDGNAYYPDLSFQLNGVTRNDFASAQGESSYPAGYNSGDFENNGQALTSQPFAQGVSALGANWETQVEEFDARLSSSTPAQTGAISLPGYSASSPGAIEYGDSLPAYGEQFTASALKQTADALSSGQSTTFDPPTPAQMTVGGDCMINFCHRFHYDHARRVVHFLGKASVSGGSNVKHIRYDLATGTWSQVGPDDPYGTPGTGHGYDEATVDSDGDFYYREEWNPYAFVFSYATQTWSTTSSQSGTDWQQIATSYTWHPNLFGAGSGGNVHCTRGDQHAWRKSDGQWFTMSPSIGLTSTSYHFFGCYVASLDKVLCGGGNDDGRDVIHVPAGAGDGVTASMSVYRGSLPIDCGTSNSQNLIIEDPRGTGVMILETSSAQRVWTSPTALPGTWSLESFTHPFYQSSGCGVFACCTFPQYGVLWGLSIDAAGGNVESQLWKPG